MAKKKFKVDFAGWCTKNDIRCSDGRIIRQDAFKEQDGETVPLVYMHNHDEVDQCLGSMLLENRSDGVWGYGSFETKNPNGEAAKNLVNDGHITHLSIYANKLVQNKATGEVLHGHIREVSLVLAGANPGAHIEFPVLEHGDLAEDEAIIYMNLEGEEIIHGEGLKHWLAENKSETEQKNETEKTDIQDAQVEDTLVHAEEDGEMAEKEKTVEEIFNTLTDEQKNAVYVMIAYAVEHGGNIEDENDDDEEEGMKHSVFDNQNNDGGDVLSHADEMAILQLAKDRGLNLKKAIDTYIKENIAHADTYGIQGVDILFPNAHELYNEPPFINEDDTWVGKVLNGASTSPFEKIRTTFADIRGDEARAKGYITATRKEDEVFSLLRRETDAQMIYKRQKHDRETIMSITDFDVVAYTDREMDIKLREELARAALIGDGRLPSNRFKIREANIRPIVNDADLFSVRASVITPNGADEDTKAKAFIKAAIKARKQYKGSGNPTLFTTEDLLTDMLLLTDNDGRDLYTGIPHLCTKLRVKEIVTVPYMEGLQVSNVPVMGIIVNMKDYVFGNVKGGQITSFQDFDIDFNQYIYLKETKKCGALTVPFSAIVLYDGTAPAAPDGGVISTKITTTDEDPEDDTDNG